jgi:hypothetical protein
LPQGGSDLVGKDSPVTKSSEYRLGTVPAPGEAIAYPGVAQIANEEVFAQRFSERDEILVSGVNALCVRQHSGILLPDAEVMLFVDIVDLAFPGRVAEADNLADEM